MEARKMAIIIYKEYWNEWDLGEPSCSNYFDEKFEGNKFMQRVLFWIRRIELDPFFFKVA